MSWFGRKNDISKKLSEHRQKFNAKIEQINSQYVDRIEKEKAPILDILPVGACWTEVIDGIQVVEPQFPYDKNHETVFVINAKEGTKIGPHKHYEQEIVHVISGMYKDSVSGNLNIYGDTEKYKPLTPHGMEFLQDTVLLVHWKKLTE